MRACARARACVFACTGCTHSHAPKGQEARGGDEHRPAAVPRQRRDGPRQPRRAARHRQRPRQRPAGGGAEEVEREGDEGEEQEDDEDGAERQGGGGAVGDGHHVEGSAHEEERAEEEAVGERERERVVHAVELGVGGGGDVPIDARREREEHLRQGRESRKGVMRTAGRLKRARVVQLLILG